MTNTDDEIRSEPPRPRVHWKVVFRNTLYILATLFFFLFALDLMISSLERIGKPVAETIILATSNPFAGLFIGLLVTAIIQSSSAATSVVVALVASGALTLEAAVPVIMGANIGTTITSTIVSLGFITKKKEFKRAVAAGTYHSFFNILTAVVLFPAEYYYGFLSKASRYLATTFFDEPIGPLRNDFSILGSGFRPIIDFLISAIDNSVVLVVLSVALIFGSIVFFRKVILNVLGFRRPDRFQRYFFPSPMKSFAWGMLTTAAIRSSTITTSLVVPLVAKKIVKLKSAVPFIMGANVGTTITAFIAAMFNSNAAISIAISHFLFNFIGVLLFFPIPYLSQIPVNLATGLASLTRRHRIVGFAYLFLTFFFIPFSLIYLSKKNILLRELTYEHREGNQAPVKFRIISKIVKNQRPEADAETVIQQAGLSETTFTMTYRKFNHIVVSGKSFEFNPIGTCLKESQGPAATTCVREFHRTVALPDGGNVDSVYVFESRLKQPSDDSTSQWYYISAAANLMVRKEMRDKSGAVLNYDQLKSLKKR